MFEWQLFLIALALELSGFGWLLFLITSFWSVIINLLNSNFSTALLGAFAGAYGGQYIVEKSKSKETLLAEIRHTNNAIILIHDICNRCISTKRQHLKETKETYDRERAGFIAFREALQRGKIAQGAIYKLVTDFRILPPTETPIEILQEQLFEKTSPGAHALTLVTILKQALFALKDMMERKNDFIEQYKTLSASGQIKPMTAFQYFGVPDENGHLDESIKSFIDSIYILNDDCIFFSNRLLEVLVPHCEMLAEKFGKHAPKVIRPDFSKAEKLGLMPNPDEFADWKFAEPNSEKSLSTGRSFWRNRIKLFKKHS
ncbi:MAG TPA: hypothetical protein VFS04_05185 [Alphaproteobacteria bacterium]|nr:hypothetical protein [Alphaproteobacteria bacterium]